MLRLLLLLAVLAPGVSAAATVEGLKSMLEQTTTARARFAQMVLDKNMKKLQQATGTMQFARPGKFRWEYDKPYEQVIVSDGARVWLYDKDLNQVTVRKYDRGGAADAGHRLRADQAGLRQGRARGDGAARPVRPDHGDQVLDHRAQRQDPSRGVHLHAAQGGGRHQ
jgi:hypothetical protein